MSHELRTPLNAILGFDQLLEQDPTSPVIDKQKEYVEHILEGGDHLLNLIDQVLDLAKIESGALPISLDDVDLDEIFQDRLTLIAPLSERFGSRVSLDQQTTAPPWVHADGTRLKQVLLNLLWNAVKYNRPGGMVHLEWAEAEDKMVRIAVSDTFPGIPKAKQGDLFMPFSRLGAETTNTEGTGIGLTLTKQIIEVMGGRIGFESAKDKGSTFWIEIAKSTEKAAKKGKIAANSNSRRRRGGRRERTLLYVEDNPANQRLMEEITEQIANLRMLSAHSAELGLEMARKYQPDLVIMDINLPGMNGIEAMKLLKRAKVTRAIPVIALSANAVPQDIKKSLKAGFDEYLTKPINLDQVLAAIIKGLAKKGAREKAKVKATKRRPSAAAS